MMRYERILRLGKDLDDLPGQVQASLAQNSPICPDTGEAVAVGLDCSLQAGG